MNGGGTKLVFPGLSGFYAAMEPIAYAIVRVVFGWIMIMHGWPKWTRGAEAVGTAFANNYGLPRGLAYFAIFLEVIGGAAVVVGLFTRFFASALAIELLIAMFAAHWAKGFSVGQGGYETCCSSASSASCSRSAAAAPIPSIAQSAKNSERTRRASPRGQARRTHTRVSCTAAPL